MMVMTWMVEKDGGWPRGRVRFRSFRLLVHLVVVAVRLFSNFILSESMFVLSVLLGKLDLGFSLLELGSFFEIKLL